MQITAKDLSTIPGITVLINQNEVTVEEDPNFLVFNDEFFEEEKAVVIFKRDNDVWYCPYDRRITLNESGEGTIDLTEGDSWDTYGDDTLSIKVMIEVPLTAEILLKKRIGIL
nr:MAG: hypothetical protein [Bacteriophage sp.]